MYEHGIYLSRAHMTYVSQPDIEVEAVSEDIMEVEDIPEEHTKNHIMESTMSCRGLITTTPSQIHLRQLIIQAIGGSSLIPTMRIGHKYSGISTLPGRGIGVVAKDSLKFLSNSLEM
jgi:hypothetical protein